MVWILALGLGMVTPPPSADLLLRVGETTPIEGEDFALHFEEVRSDSRCPKDAQCFWAGEAIVVLEVRPREGEPVELTFSVPPGGEASATYQDCIVQVLGLEPENESGRRLEQDEYVAKLQVTRDAPRAPLSP